MRVHRGIRRTMCVLSLIIAALFILSGCAQIAQVRPAVGSSLALAGPPQPSGDAIYIESEVTQAPTSAWTVSRSW